LSTRTKLGVEKAFRNLPGVDIAPVKSLSLLQLAPGGHLGRFVIWSESAFKDLDKIYGVDSSKPCPLKRNFRLPRSSVTCADVTRVINSAEVQAVIRKKRVNIKRSTVSKNPLRSGHRVIRCRGNV